MKRLRRILLGLFSLALLLPAICCCWIERSSRPYLYDSTEAIPANRVAVVLGTSKYLSKSKQNPFYTTRIEAAAALYRAGKAQYFIVSGANPSRYYNEPEEMRRDLIKAGIPAANIQPDYAGLRTLDSMLRADKVFGNQKFTIVSQPFHNARAVFIARRHGIDAIGYNARDPVPIISSLKTRVREIGARMLAVLDIFLTNKQAKYYGDKIPFPPPNQP